MSLIRMDNVEILVYDLEGRATIGGGRRVTELRDQRVETAMMRMPDGHGRPEPPGSSRPPSSRIIGTPVNALGYVRAMFAVKDMDETVIDSARAARRCLIRGLTGLLIGPAQELS